MAAETVNYRAAAADWLIAATIATEVPPRPVVRRDIAGEIVRFSEDMIAPAVCCVAEVIRNRVADPQFPNTALAVVWYGAPPNDGRASAFSAVGSEYWWRAVEGLWFPEHVEYCLDIWLHPSQTRLADGALYYYSPVSMVPPYREPRWAARLTEIAVPQVDANYFRWFK